MCIMRERVYERAVVQCVRAKGMCERMCKN